ncbi:hypothetical protein PSHT_05616 [Puccinia striiformis]|uniref:Uncharacterized protein n=1 Tax=Puccinia striiformis TaxID=27350 RepID=A0A2S4WA68_9BASI|nr:hypothetical protein PSHT_05616 [Puccinia striiformis]
MDSKSRSISFLSDATNRQAPPPDTHFLPRGEPPFSLDNWPPPLTSSPSSHSINTATPNPIQAASPAIDSLADLESVHTWPTSNLTTPDPDADPNSNVFKPLSSCIDPPATTPADSEFLAEQSMPLNNTKATLMLGFFHPRIINALSEAHCHPGDPILPDPPLLNNQLPSNLELKGTSVAPNLAPDLPHSALQHNADIDNYLNLADTDETEMKKKKKKKAKPTLTSDNLVSDPTSNPDNPVLFYV